MQREKKYQIEERQTELDTGFHPGLLELENDKPLKDNFQNLDIVTCCYFMHWVKAGRAYNNVVNLKTFFSKVYLSVN